MTDETLGPVPEELRVRLDRERVILQTTAVKYMTHMRERDQKTGRPAGSFAFDILEMASQLKAMGKPFEGSLLALGLTHVLICYEEYVSEININDPDKS